MPSGVKRKYSHSFFEIENTPFRSPQIPDTIAPA